MNLTGKRVNFRRHRPLANPYRLLILLILVMCSMFVLRALNTQQIQSPFAPTPIPTRSAASHALEGETHFKAGNVDAAVAAYNRGLELDQSNVDLASELARIQVYSSTLVTTDAEKRARLDAALATATQAVAINPDDSTAHAVRALALDWLANPNLVGDEWEKYLNEAWQEAGKALQLDSQNPLALAYYAEILVDQAQWLQAEQVIAQALDRGEEHMDVHRVNAYVLETLSDYKGAIEEYKKAIEISPNLTFLYISVGVNYRTIANYSREPAVRNQNYEDALTYFAMAANINEQLGIQDPIPYKAIGNTYAQIGEFFIASQNMRKALSFDPTNPDMYGSVGMVYFKARNYEGAIEALQCAVKGCTPEESCTVRRCDEEVDPRIEIEGLPLTSSTVLYYYTYGSVLAGMSRSYNDYCERANEVLRQVRNGFSEDAVIMQIIEPSEEICRAGGAQPALPSPTIIDITLTPDGTLSPTVEISPTSTMVQPTITPTILIP